MEHKYKKEIEEKVEKMVSLFKVPILFNIKPKHHINGISLFANVGIDEAYLEENGIKIKVSNEI